MSDSDTALLREIRDLLLALPAAIAAQLNAPRRQLKPEDEAALTTLLPAIFGAVGNETLPVRLLFERAKANTAPAIRLGDALRSVAEGNAREVGHLLSRGVGHVVDGHTVIACSEPTREGILWRVRKA